MLIRAALLFISLFFITACQDYKVIAVKDFRIYADTKDPILQRSIETLAARYNQEMGSKVLTIVRDPSASNSKISFKNDLPGDGHTLGLGQWITTSQESSQLSIMGETNTSTVAYAMEIEFDLENFRTKAPYLDQATSDQALHLYHLFCHEIGHGLQLDHSDSIQSVMYKKIPDRPTRYIDYKSYFKEVRAFMSRN
jgi:hypothetical protein